ncbi:MAG: hypothetical protein K0R54_3805 [Clostridiaceae bacterium]|jgi:uncharacterized membrane protein (DUF441 family)|nr:hypothetical protein [Clostridiaceae bacterium]
MIDKIILIVLIVASIFAKNKSMIVAAAIVLLFSIINNNNIIKFSRKYFLDLGMMFLMIWTLVPIIDKESQSSVMNLKNLININGIVSLISGILVVVIASKGVKFLNGNTSVMGGVVTGSIVGITFLSGVPVGPLIASGIAYLVVKLLERII